MAKFEFFVDELRPNWWRYRVVVDADSEKEAIEKAVEFDGDIIDSEWITDSGTLMQVEVIDTRTEEVLYDKIFNT